MKPVKLNAGDRLRRSKFGFSLNSTVEGFQDGVDFYLQPGGTALLSVEQDGVANSRQVFVGGDTGQLTPAGWVLEPEDLPKRPDFDPGKELGLFVGQGKDSSNLEFRLNSDGAPHKGELNVLTSAAADFTPVKLNANDKLSFGKGQARRHYANVKSRIRPRFDGLDVALSKSGKVGFTYTQDGRNRPRLVNRTGSKLGTPNAYELPMATPFGKPNYDSATEKGVFLWKEEGSDVWKLRATGGG